MGNVFCVVDLAESGVKSGWIYIFIYVLKSVLDLYECSLFDSLYLDRCISHIILVLLFWNHNIKGMS